MTKLPTFYLAHGGGPLPVLGDPLHASLTASLKNLRKNLPVADQISSILIVSAHWEETKTPTVTSNPSPQMIYDYYGFPPESYEIKYNSSGNPSLASRIATLLQTNNIPCKLDSTRGYDHGAYIPLLLAFPDAKIPVVQLSLVSSLDPELHIKIGEAIAPLREEGVLLIGSGMSFHNMQVFRSSMMDKSGNQVDTKSKQFDEYLQHTITGQISWEERRKNLVGWVDDAPAARYCHPREEHLLPLMVVAGAAMHDSGTTIYNDVLLGTVISSFKFG